MPVALPSKEEGYQPSFSSGYSKVGGGGIIKERKCHQYNTKNPVTALGQAQSLRFLIWLSFYFFFFNEGGWG